MALISSKRIYYIDSHERVSGTHENFSFKVEIPKTESFDKVVVLSAMIPKSYYLIQSGQNTFTLSEIGLPNVVITVDVGNYSATSFRTRLASLLSTNSPHGWTYTITYPNTAITSNTGKFTYNVSGNGASQPSFIFTTFMHEQFGFEPNSTNTFVANSITSTHVVKMQVKDTLFIHSDISSNGRDDILQEIFGAPSPDFSSIKYECVDVEAYSKDLTTQNHNIYNFFLTDEDGILMNLNGLNMVITLCVYKRDSLYEMLKDYMKLRTVALKK